MFDFQSIIIDALTLSVHNPSDKNKRIIYDLIDRYEKEKKKTGILGNEEEAINGIYIKIIKDIFNNVLDPSDENAIKIFLIKLKKSVIFKKNLEAFEDLSEIFKTRETLKLESLMKSYESLKEYRMRDALLKESKRISAIIYRSQRDEKPIDSMNVGINDLKEKLTAIQKESRDNSDPNNVFSGSVDFVDYENIDSIKEASNKRKERINNGSYVTGLVGLNQALGGNIGRGESVFFAAPSHNYKSGILKSIAYQILIHNKPTHEEKKSKLKPLVLFISLEDEVYQCMHWMHDKVYRVFNDDDPTDKSDDEMNEFCKKKMTENGFSFKIVRYKPEDFDYRKYCDTIETLENLGYIVVMSVVDYLTKMKLDLSSRSSSQANHLEIGELCSKMCHYNKTKGITFISAHQLNREADKLASNGQINVVKHFGASVMGGSVSVFQEVDAVVFLYLERNLSGHKFLTGLQSKRRYHDNIPDTRKYFAYVFDGENGIMDDYNKSKPQYIRDIYQYDDGSGKTKENNSDIF